jgi:ABC-type Zn uptake system ZnuABC Zn-binding protein ZnuA
LKYESVPVSEIIEQYPALSKTIKENSTSFLEKVCEIDQKLDEKLRVFREWKETWGEI